MSSRVTFVLPGYGGGPVGGVKVVYEYANGLVARGYAVTVVHPAFSFRGAPVVSRLKSCVRFVQRTLDKSYLPSRWFNLDPRVRALWVPSLAEKYIPDGDAIVATAWMTAEWVAEYAARKGEKYYLIQHFENWAGPEDRVIGTWKLPLRKIVISKWLGDVARSLGEQFVYIPNGLDFRKFGIDEPIEKRPSSHVMMLYHDHVWKGSADGLQALKIARSRHSELRVSLFGVSKARSLPPWIRYFQNPTQDLLRNIYNSSAIFVSPSWTEGWPLPPAEAMMCGVAVVATDIGGHREYADDDVTALLAPVKHPEALAERIVMLLENTDKRVEIARSGHKNIQQFTWERACDAFEEALSKSRPGASD